MPIHELRQLSRTIAVSRAQDLDQQRWILGELQNIWGSQLDQGSTTEIDSYFEFAIELARYLAEGRTPGPEEILTMMTRFLARAESTMARPRISATGREVVLKLPDQVEAAEPNPDPDAAPTPTPAPHPTPAPPPERSRSEAGPLSLIGGQREPKPGGGGARAREETAAVGLNDVAMGELLIHLGILSSEQIATAVQQQDRGERIGQTCMRLGFATREQIEEAAQLQRHLRDHAKTKPVPGKVQDRGAALMEWQQSLLGGVLVDIGAITPTQLNQSLKGQRATGLLLGEVLVQMGSCDWKTVRSAIRIQEAMRKQVEDPWRSKKDPRIA